MKIATLLCSAAAMSILTACASKTDTAVKMMEQEMTSLSSGCPAKAIAIADEEIKKGTRDPWVYTHRAQACIRTGKLEEAEKDIAQAHALGQKKDIELMMKAQIAMKRNEYEKAAAFAGEAAKMNPKAQTPVKMEEAAFKRALQVKKAEMQLTNAIAVSKTPSEKAFNTVNLAKLEYYNMPASKDKAIKRLEAACIEHPDNSSVADALAWFLIMTGKDNKRGLEIALENVKTEPYNCIFNDTLAAAYAANGDFDKAMTSLEKAIELLPHPLNSNLYCIVSCSFEDRKKAYEAKTNWTEAPQEIRAVWYIPEALWHKIDPST